MPREPVEKEIVRIFVIEARQLVERLGGEVRALGGAGQTGSGVSMVDRVFLAFHTIAGTAEVLELPGAAREARGGEDVMWRIRRGECLMSVGVVEDLLERVGRLHAELLRLTEYADGSSTEEGGGTWNE